MPTRGVLLEALQSDDVGAFLKFCSPLKSRGIYHFEDTLDAVPRKHFDPLWKSGLTFFRSLVATPASALEHGDGDADVEEGDASPANVGSMSEDTLQALHAMVSLAHAFLAKFIASAKSAASSSRRAASAPPAAFFDTIKQLLGILYEIPQCQQRKTIQNDISRLAEVYWRNALPNREQIVAECLPWILVESLLPTSKAADVRRVYDMREAIHCFELDHFTSDTLKHLLLRCVISPLYLRSSHGQKFLSFIFTLDADFIDMIHRAIKSQLPSARVSLVEAYAQVYFKAWWMSDDDWREVIEEKCIQDLMVCAVQVKSDKTAKVMRRFMAHFHNQKEKKGVDEMLFRLYEPIIWRSLKAANATVRYNAASLFADAFPLQNPLDNRVEAEKSMQNQFTELEALLKDQDWHVRALGVKAVCRVLGQYWEMIPFGVTKALLKRLTKDLANDVSSVQVRIAVFEGLSYVREECPLSHSVLQVMLPRMAHLVHDRSEQVRTRFVDMLLGISRTRTIRFFKVVELDTLLTRLAIDTPPIAVRLTKLLQPSFLPFKKPPETQLARTVKILREHPESARVFYENVHLFVQPGAICNLIAIIHNALIQCIQREPLEDGSADAANALSQRASNRKKKKDMVKQEDGKRKRKLMSKKRGELEPEEDGDGSDKENGGSAKKAKVDEPLVTRADPSLVSGLLCTMAQLLHSIQDKLQDDDADDDNRLRSSIEAIFSDGSLERFLVEFDFDNESGGQVARAAILLLASELPEACAVNLKEQCLPELCRLTAEEPVSEFGPFLECLFAWHRHGELLSAIASAVEQGFEEVLKQLPSEEAEVGVKANGKRKRASKAQRRNPRRGRNGADAQSDAEAASPAEPVPALSPLVALRYLSYVMENGRTRRVFFSSECRDERHRIKEVMNTGLAVLEKRMTIPPRGDLPLAEARAQAASDDFLFEAFRCTIKLPVHTTQAKRVEAGADNAEKHAKLPQSVAALLTWCVDTVLPRVVEAEAEADEDGDDSGARADGVDDDEKESEAAAEAEAEPKRKRVRFAISNDDAEGGRVPESDLPLATRIAMFASLFSAEISTLGMFLVTPKDGGHEDAAAAGDVGSSSSSVCSPVDQQTAIFERFESLDSKRLPDICKHTLKTLHHTSALALASPKQQQPLLAPADLSVHQPPLRSVLSLLHTLLRSSPARVRQSREFERTLLHLLRSTSGGDVLTVLLTVVLKNIVDPSEVSQEILRSLESVFDDDFSGELSLSARSVLDSILRCPAAVGCLPSALQLTLNHLKLRRPKSDLESDEDERRQLSGVAYDQCSLSLRMLFDDISSGVFDSARSSSKPNSVRPIDGAELSPARPNSVRPIDDAELSPSRPNSVRPHDRREDLEHGASEGSDFEECVRNSILVLAGLEASARQLLKPSSRLVRLAKKIASAHVVLEPFISGSKSGELSALSSKLKDILSVHVAIENDDDV